MNLFKNTNNHAKTLYYHTPLYNCLCFHSIEIVNKLSITKSKSLLSWYELWWTNAWINSKWCNALILFLDVAMVLFDISKVLNPLLHQTTQLKQNENGGVFPTVKFSYGWFFVVVGTYRCTFISLFSHLLPRFIKSF